MLELGNYKLEINVKDKEVKDKLFDKRQEIIKIAVNWEGDTTKDQIVYNKIWTYKEEPAFTVGLGKMGKEYYRPNNMNANDMRPTITNNGKIVEGVKGDFNDIFNLMESITGENKENVLLAFAVLFLRNAFLLDHKIIDGKYCYEPDTELLKYICEGRSSYESVPMEVYIHFLDAIALNEDVKYWTKGKLNKSTGVGRENNMKTYVYYICCLLNKEPWSKFVYKFMRGRGVAALSNNDVAKNFPALGLKYRERKQESGKIPSQPITITEIKDQESKK